MAKTNKWIQGAIKHPGAATAAAKREGLTVHQWAVKHQHDGGVVGDRARMALTLEKTNKKKTKTR